MAGEGTSTQVTNIIKQFKDKAPLPLYLLHGEEAYYIDEVTDAATKYILEEHEKDFNLTILYGKDVNLDQLQEQVKQFPMMSERQVVIVKEAQYVKNWDLLLSYFENPNQTTVLILAHKHKPVDKRKKFVKLFQKNGVILESKKLYDSQIDGWISNYLRTKGYSIEPKAVMLLSEFLGTDLGKIVKEVEKLAIVLEKGSTITSKDIEKNIGFSKDYNAFELINAIAAKDILKANRIINYFEQNPKATHITVLVGVLFSFFNNLMKAHFSGARDINGLMSQLKMPYPAAKDVMKAKMLYNQKITARNITYIHQYDLKSKGIERGPGTDADLLRELIYLLMH